MNMMKHTRYVLPGLIFIFFLGVCTADQAAMDPLPSWNNDIAKQRIVDFVASVTDPGNETFVPGSERIATFDNDGTLWSEKPTYFQLMFIIDRVKSMAVDHPEWTTTQPFQAVLEDDMTTLKSAGMHGLLELAMATHAGMTTEEFETIVKDWLAIAKHPTTGKAFTEMVYQPMLELISYLRENDFKVFIVSGGGIEFMRPWTEAVYGIPPEQVVGSSIETHYEIRAGKPAIVRDPKLHFIDDKDTKPLAINRFIGRRPILAGGNSDGDFEMLEWTTAGDGARLVLIVHHTDAEREWAYDRESSEGRLDRGLDEANEKGWILVDMARDWKVIFPSEGGE